MGEVLRQHQDIFPPLPQGGEGNHIKRESVQQIVAKQSFICQRREILVGSADQPHIHLEGLGPAHSLELAILDDPQQLLLHPGAGGGQLVEEEGAAIGPLEAALMALGCAGKGARLVTEQLGLQQTLAQSGAVDGDKALIPARREIM